MKLFTNTSTCKYFFTYHPDAFKPPSFSPKIYYFMTLVTFAMTVIQTNL